MKKKFSLKKKKISSDIKIFNINIKFSQILHMRVPGHSHVEPVLRRLVRSRAASCFLDPQLQVGAGWALREEPPPVVVVALVPHCWMTAAALCPDLELPEGLSEVSSSADFLPPIKHIYFSHLVRY